MFTYAPRAWDLSIIAVLHVHCCSPWLLNKSSIAGLLVHVCSGLIRHDVFLTELEWGGLMRLGATSTPVVILRFSGDSRTVEK